MPASEPSFPLHPIFLDLAHRTVLVVGAGKVGLRKTREFLDCGAKVRVISPLFQEGFAALEGRFQKTERTWLPGDEGGCRLVVAATSDPATNRAIYAICSQRGILCNVTDVPELCDWQAAAVARSGPVQIAVGTAGKAPSLASFARRELQDWMDDGFVELVDLYAKLREESRALLSGPEREHFWKTLPPSELLDLLRREGATACELHIRALLATAAGTTDSVKASAPARTGRVILVGAGPGHPDLVTRLGLKMLGRATALVHDRLVSDELLRAVPTSCEIHAVGKTGFGKSHGQSDINELIVKLAREGHVVVRLKGGDSFVFGRGGEEIEACQAAGIPVEIVPGVSASLAVPAWHGIPITHRGLSRSFAVVSGFHADGTEARIPDVETVIVMMPLHSVDSVRRRFLEAGWDASTPCAAIHAGTTPDEASLFSNLGDIDRDLAASGLESPLMVVVGKVVGWAREHAPEAARTLTAGRGGLAG